MPEWIPRTQWNHPVMQIKEQIIIICSHIQYFKPSVAFQMLRMLCVKLEFLSDNLRNNRTIYINDKNYFDKHGRHPVEYCGMRYTQIKELKPNGPCIDNLHCYSQEQKCFSDWFNYFNERQSSICRSDADDAFLTAYIY